METEIRVKTPEIRIIRVETQEIIEDRIILTTTVITAATVMRSHSNAE
jgi:hypothetical protein